MADRYIPEHRRTTFKAKSVFKPEELRRRREEQQVEIRKAKREENLAKRRGIAGRDAPGASLGAAPDSDDEGGNIENQVGYLSRVFIRFIISLHEATLRLATPFHLLYPPLKSDGSLSCGFVLLA